MLLRSARDLTAARGSLKRLAESGSNLHLLDSAKARAVEPGLNPERPRHAAVHLPGDEVGNYRQFAHLLRAAAQRLGAVCCFQRTVLGLVAGPQTGLPHRDNSSAGAAAGTPQRTTFDAIVVCAAIDADALLRPLGLRLPLVAVHGYSITAPPRLLDARPHLGPAAAVVDEKYKVAISRLGQRMRVAGDAELGGRLGQHRAGTVHTLHRVLDGWYPGCAQQGQWQGWKGARPMLPDGPPGAGRQRRTGCVAGPGPRLQRLGAGLRLVPGAGRPDWRAHGRHRRGRAGPQPLARLKRHRPAAGLRRRQPAGCRNDTGAATASPTSR